MFSSTTSPSFCLCQLSSVLISWCHQIHQAFLQRLVPGEKTFHFGYCTFYPKPLPTSESLIHLDLFLSMCENGIPSPFPQGASGALPLLPGWPAFSLSLRGHLGHSSSWSVSGFFATLPGLIGLFLRQDHSSHFLELYEFSMHLVRQHPPPFFFKPNLLGPPWRLMFLY